ncbi:bifunctional diaminohydroxyphosphoribosylaminopyrimidine deaminase/5-amino-6-(5-phosphoribosylamino)uracil reductase RibD [Alteromonas aestuariivivens]|uniref:Riboflavin biosynthesis protein RibD n=1 Tax=Alteromonas aestuariivivens TaxID=1938339 RepID=A0A3D8MF00_9ALTE|nr:bifunctional diaminohydroxyphosphoribosylaminopyrimidine deaminase/5-amino-6-(5-phosphoribosylamino)uracil reductase RibD [Alteromonas aestuariivivens]RDV29449.1 bifunctional diaminohydroxyphosphoribosylaminopyrimidine deaminase/5-amino-6-(5-phosphoribosylamino)uracil reductase RibD [Alteromonas aestuariivivens]
MAEAIKLARKGRFTTSPNPRVGCIVLDASGELVGQGYHIQAGTPHAEVHALRQAAERANGGTAYVTLEPCSHFGRTPPCADALIESGVSRVVVAMTDPNPQVSGQGIRRLRDAGIEVVCDVLRSQAEQLNRGFIKRMTTGLPWITVKMAISLDGKIALANGVSQWITGPQARRDVQLHRAASCGVLTGSGTALADDPSLLVREQQARFDEYPLETLRQPVRIVVDTAGSLPETLQLFRDGFTTWIASASGAAAASDNVINLPTGRNGKVDLRALLVELGQRQLNEVWVEAGPLLAGAFFADGLVDELIVYQAPKLLGSEGRSMLVLPEFTALNQAIELELQHQCQVGNDSKMTYLVRRTG